MTDVSTVSPSVLTLAKLIRALGATPPDQIRVVRHTVRGDRQIVKDHGHDKWPDGEPAVLGDDKLIRLRLDRELTAAYTAYQHGDRFTTKGRKGRLADLLIVFAATENLGAEFLGAWRVVGRLDYAGYCERYQNLLKQHPPVFPSHHPLVLDGLGLSGPSPSDHFYDLRRDEALLSGMEGRLVVQWPQDPRNWIRTTLELEVLEIRSAGFVRPFLGYDRVDLPFNELCLILASPAGNPEWALRLNAIPGIYLITDASTGKLYVGSATGVEGLWQRWVQYKDTRGHGGNKGLIHLLAKDPDYASNNFRFSLLQVMPRQTPTADIIAAENRWKQRLGSRAEALGYNWLEANRPRRETTTSEATLQESGEDATNTDREAPVEDDFMGPEDCPSCGYPGCNNDCVCDVCGEGPNAHTDDCPVLNK